MEGSEQPGSKFDQNRVGGSDRSIMDQVGKKNTRDRVGVSKRASGGERSGRVSDQGVSVAE